MSIVNQVSKDNVIYDMNDKRVFILDIGSVSIVEGQFQSVISYANAEAFFNAEEGILKFTFSGTNVVCKTIAKNQSGTSKMAMCSMFLQAQENSYTSFMCQVMGDSSEQTGQVNGYMVEQSIPQGGGSGGDGATIITLDTSEAQWVEEDEYTMAMVMPTEEQYNAISNNDNVIVKFNDESDETHYTFKSQVASEGGESMFFCGSALSEEIGMVVIMRQDDGDGGYIYVAQIAIGKMPSGETTLYYHQIQNCVGTVEVESATHTNQQFTIRVTSDYPNEFDSASNMFSQLLGAPSFTGMLIFTVQETDPDTQETTYHSYKLPILGAIDKDDEKGFVYTDGVDNHILLQSDITTFGTDNRYPI